ncbi:hypothetical protein [Nocardia sp. XZ_19_385]|uniref:hypothetical protein n=1 Tax=Nocardia sp. XZ_19_385 TaxID=2769488 RepID=UPI00188F868A|nr:hypothetical protein [Nocardia sp. XZ_19_385]
MRDEAQTRLRTLKRDYDEGQTRLLQLEQQAAGLREGLLRISGAIQVLEELLVDNNVPSNGEQRDPEELRVP